MQPEGIHKKAHLRTVRLLCTFTHCEFGLSNICVWFTFSYHARIYFLKSLFLSKPFGNTFCLPRFYCMHLFWPRNDSAPHSEPLSEPRSCCVLALSKFRSDMYELSVYRKMSVPWVSHPPLSLRLWLFEDRQREKRGESLEVDGKSCSTWSIKQRSEKK